MHTLSKYDMFNGPFILSVVTSIKTPFGGEPAFKYRYLRLSINAWEALGLAFSCLE